MNAESRFFEQFIDDYFAETDEHLANVRRVLLELDATTGELASAPRLQALARYLHTLKGLSGMVGFAPAEHVAHAMEDRARQLRELRSVDGAVIQDLFEGAALLEQCVAARRAGTGIPDVGAYVERIRSTDGTDRRLAHRAGSEFTFTFTPSAECTARGIGVETIRDRLGTRGTVQSAAPRVLAGGGVVFVFVVAVHDDADIPDEWRNDGLEWEATHPGGRPGGKGALAPVTDAALTHVIPAPAANAVRVDLARLDDIMRMVGDLVVSRARIDEMLEARAPGVGSARWEDLREANVTMERQLRALREGITRIRLVPIGEVFERMRFAMREIAREAGKHILLDLHGQDTEIDKLVVDRMLEPLLHLVRNAVGHGIEPPARRLARGKPAEGLVTLRARAEGDRIFLEIEDDGGGIDVDAVARRAQEAGMLAYGDELSAAGVLDVLCESGFSTRHSADMSSGRGVGMAVVRSAVRGLGGELAMHTAPGVGTRYVIELPLTLMIVDALLFDVGSQAFAVPQLVLREILELEQGAVTRIENNEVIPYRAGVLPLIELRRVFGIRAGTPAAGTRHVLVVGADDHLSGLVVDGIVGLREIVVHSVTDPLVALPGISGATELSDGRVSLIIDTSAIMRRKRDHGGDGRFVAPARPRQLARELARELVS